MRMSTETLLANVRLRTHSDVVPEAGLTVARLRVELSDQQKKVGAWMAEIKVDGELPWRWGEERRVELRIMSPEFRSYVASSRPKLLVCRGAEVVGDLWFEGGEDDASPRQPTEDSEEGKR